MNPLRLTSLIMFALCSMLLHAQTLNVKNWLSGIDDNRPVSSLSIPGAHDAATGEGLFVAGLGKTQTLGLAEMWDCGVRAFDLRPAYVSDVLGIYHGKIKTKVTFGEALDILSAKLDETPGEFAIVLMREEVEAEKNPGRQRWPQALGEHIEALGSKAAIFKPGMTVGDLRGKILFISRNAYTGTNKGALISGWTHDDKGITDACITSYSNGESVRLQMQDYYAPTDDDKRQAKCTAVLNFITLAGRAPKDVWTINFLSGYCTTWLGITPFATTSGYKHNAASLHPIVIDYISKHHKASLGIMFMDFAGTDKVKGGISHWNNFYTYGARLVQLIIEQNL